MLPCIRKDNAKKDSKWEDIIKKEKSLYIKEKELLQKEALLQRKIKKYEDRANCKAKADLRAAAKLREARKKLLFALDSRHKLQECHAHNCKNKKDPTKRNHIRNVSKGKFKKGNPFTDVVFDFCEKALSHPCTQNNILKPIPDFKLCRPYKLPHSCNDFIRVVPPKETVWNLTARDCYLRSLRSTPQPWIYHRWPQFYPNYLDVRKQWKNVGYFMLFIAGFLLWVPLLLCLELFKCFCCACCCDY